MKALLRRFGVSLGSAALTVSALGCAPQSQDAPLRSPSLDYAPASPSTADGEGLGADGVSPGQKLEEGPNLGSDPKPAPGWEVDGEGLHHDPKRQVGGAVDPPSPASPPLPPPPSPKK